MKRLSFILLLCAIVSIVNAQRITKDFQDVTLSDALKYIQSQTADYDITFIYDELMWNISLFPMPYRRLLAFIPFALSRVEDKKSMWNASTRPTAT